MGPGYCALLSIAGIGLVRFGRRALLLLGVPAVVALAPGVIGFALLSRPEGSIYHAAAWWTASHYLINALAAWGICLVFRGWALYFTNNRSQLRTRAEDDPE